MTCLHSGCTPCGSRLFLARLYSVHRSARRPTCDRILLGQASHWKVRRLYGAVLGYRFELYVRRQNLQRLAGYKVFLGLLRSFSW